MSNESINMLNCLSKNAENPIIYAERLDLISLFEDIGKTPPIRQLTNEEKTMYEHSLDNVSALCIPKPKTKAEEAELVRRFLSGFGKLLSKDDNWTFWEPLMLSLENCVRCQVCSDACPIFLASGRAEIYRPSYRAEIMRSIKSRYFDKISSWAGERDSEINWTLVSRLAELSYRCTLCRRCALVCPMGVDNGLITRELRKLFSQEMGIAPKELHAMGTMTQLDMPSGYPADRFNQMVEIVEGDIAAKTGHSTKLPVDKTGADFLFIQTSFESPAWLKCPECFAIIFEKAGLDWTLSSELGFGGANFGLWYDDIQFGRIVHQQIRIAKKLKVKRIVLGECGHAFKGMASVADRIISPDDLIPRMSWLPLVADIVESGRLELDARRNDFVVTLHDPCNIARLMGLVDPQRKILKHVCANFREMSPNGTDNYCCGGGGGLIMLSGTNFPDWRAAVSGRFKMKQLLDVFRDNLDTRTKKYICAPCFTCKLEIKDILEYYGAAAKFNFYYGGLVELVANAMPDVKEPVVNWEWPPAISNV